MGACASQRLAIRKRSVSEKISSKLRRGSGGYNDEPVDFLGAKSTREYWRRSLHSLSDSSLYSELLFDDGKVLTDFFNFLLEEDSQGLIQAWQLSTSRFALRWNGDDLQECTALAEAVEAAWDTYMESRNARYQDSRSWPELARKATGAVSSTSSPGLPSSPTKSMEGAMTVDADHEMYEFTIAAMFGIHVAMSCFTAMNSAVAVGIRKSGRDLVDIWSSTFPDIRLLRCLQNSCFRYTVPPEGTAYSPPTRELTEGRLNSTFAIEDMCPELFARFRHLCGVTNQDYYSSVCRPDVDYIELGTNSCSGEFFFFTHDGRFLLKTTTPREAETLMKMLPDLIRRFQVAPHSMLGRYVGLYRLFSEDMNYDRLFFVMMGATQHTESVWKTYDMKGSTKGRKAKPGEVVKKDLDFWDDLGALSINDETASILRATHVEDVKLLRRHKIMDYSVLLQVVDRDAKIPQGAMAKIVDSQAHMSSVGSLSCDGKVDVHMLHMAAHTPKPNSAWGRIVSGTVSNSLDNIALGKKKHVAPEDPQGVNDSSTNQWGQWSVADGSYGDVGTLPSCSSSASSHGDRDLNVDGADGIPHWRPGDGIASTDGRYLYSMAIIDMLMPFNWWYPKMQVVGQQVISCGNGDQWSRQRPGKYADRQLAMMRRMCRLSTEVFTESGSDHESGDESDDQDWSDEYVHTYDSEEEDHAVKKSQCAPLQCSSEPPQLSDSDLGDEWRPNRSGDEDGSRHGSHRM